MPPGGQSWCTEKLIRPGSQWYLPVYKKRKIQPQILWRDNADTKDLQCNLDQVKLGMLSASLPNPALSLISGLHTTTTFLLDYCSGSQGKSADQQSLNNQPMESFLPQCCDQLILRDFFGILISEGDSVSVCVYSHGPLTSKYGASLSRVLQEPSDAALMYFCQLMCLELPLIYESWNGDSGDALLPEEEPVVSDGQIQDLGWLQAGMHCTILWHMDTGKSNISNISG